MSQQVFQVFDTALTSVNTAVGQQYAVTGLVPAGNATNYTIFDARRVANGTAWKWVYTQYSAPGGTVTASAWGIFTKSPQGAYAAAELAGPLDVQQVIAGATATDAPTINFAGPAVPLALATNGANTAQGQYWTCFVTSVA